MPDPGLPAARPWGLAILPFVPRPDHHPRPSSYLYAGHGRAVNGYECVYVVTEEQERAAVTPVPYAPPAADLDAQAAADREQQEADRDYRELARLALVTDAGVCRCGAVKAPCMGCRVARWLAVGL
jgi:hypothetical protein